MPGPQLAKVFPKLSGLLRGMFFSGRANVSDSWNSGSTTSIRGQQRLLTRGHAMCHGLGAFVVMHHSSSSIHLLVNLRATRYDIRLPPLPRFSASPQHTCGRPRGRKIVEFTERVLWPHELGRSIKRPKCLNDNCLASHLSSTLFIYEDKGGCMCACMFVFDPRVPVWPIVSPPGVHYPI